MTAVKKTLHTLSLTIYIAGTLGVTEFILSCSEAGGFVAVGVLQHYKFSKSNFIQTTDISN